MLLALAAFFGAVLLIVAGCVFAELTSTLRPRRRVMVNLTDGTALGGVLWRRRGRYLVLRDARLHQPGGEAPLDGEAIVDRARVLFVQGL